MSDEVPFASRPFGWCQDYEHGPAAQHEKCDGYIGIDVARNYRCPCACHDVQVTDGPWELVLPMRTPLSMNDRVHWAKRAEQVQVLRDSVGWLAKQKRIPPCQRIRATLIYEPKAEGRRDPINLMATLKPVQDGLVDAGVIPDDTAQYIETPTPLIDIPNGKRGKVWVLVEKLA